MSRPAVDVDTADLDVQHHRGGWLSQLVVTRSAISGLRRVHRVRWRDGAPRCCPQQPMRSWGADAAPVSDFDPRSDGGITPHHRQCGRCGSLVTAPVRITELEVAR